jgi:hypothetical protein
MFLCMMQRAGQETESKLVYFSFKTTDIINYVLCAEARVENVEVLYIAHRWFPLSEYRFLAFQLAFTSVVNPWGGSGWH